MNNMQFKNNLFPIFFLNSHITLYYKDSSSPQALEAQEQEKDRLRLPQQNPSPVPGNRRSGSPRSDRTPTPEPQSSPSPAASSPDVTTTNTTSSMPQLPDQAEDTPSINGEPEGDNAPVNGGAEPVTPSRGMRQPIEEKIMIFKNIFVLELNWILRFQLFWVSLNWIMKLLLSLYVFSYCLCLH